MRIVFSAILFFSVLFNAQAKKKAIFGEDNVYDYFEYSNPFYDELSNLTLAVVQSENLKTSDNGETFDFRGVNRPLYESHKMCIDERFSKQIAEGFCSAFFVSPDLVVTAGHCINEEKCKSTKFVQGYKIDGRTQRANSSFSKDQVYSCEKILAHQFTSFGSGYEDYAIVLVDRPSSSKLNLKFKEVVQSSINNSKEVMVIGHPLGLPQKIAREGRVLSFYNDNAVNTNLDSFGGNSGSPVFDEKSGNYFGILVAGGKEGNLEFNEEKGCYQWVKCDRIQNNARCTANIIQTLTGIPEIQDGLINSFQLFDAFEKRDSEKVYHLLRSTYDVNQLSRNGYNFLQYALWLKDIDLVKRFKMEGNLIHHRDKWNRNSLHFAALSGFVEGAKYLVSERVPINTVSSIGQTALHIAASRGHADLIEYLFEIGVNADIKDEDGKTAFDFVKSKNSFDAYFAFVKRNPEKFKEFNFKSKSFLDWAIDNNNLQQIKFIVENRLYKFIDGKARFKLLKILVENNRVDIVRGIVDSDNNILRSFEKNEDGSHPLDYIFSQVNEEIFSIIINGLNNYEVTNFLKEKNFKIELYRKYVKTLDEVKKRKLATVALIHGSADVLKFMFENAESLNFMPYSLGTDHYSFLLMTLVGYEFNQDLEKIEFALSKIKSENIKYDRFTYYGYNYFGYSALHLAIQMNLPEIFKKIASHCPKIEIETNDGMTPYKLAKKLKRTKVFKPLIKDALKTCGQ